MVRRESDREADHDDDCAFSLRKHRLKRDYRAWYAKQFKSVRDPFERMGEDLTADL